MVMCVTSGALTSWRFPATPFKRCLGEGNCNQGSQNGCLCWGSKNLRRWWGNDGGWGDGREALQSSMEEREGVVGPTVVIHAHAHAHTHTCAVFPQPKHYSNIHACAHMHICAHRDSHACSFLFRSPSFSLTLQTQWCIVQPDLVPVQRQREPRLLKQRAHY